LAFASGFAASFGLTRATVFFPSFSARTPDWWNGARCFHPCFRTIDENVVGIILSAAAPHFGQAAGWSDWLIERNASKTLSQLSQ
jgi:hypothetical protein